MVAARIADDRPGIIRREADDPVIAPDRRQPRHPRRSEPHLPREAAYRFASLDYPATERRFNCYYAEFLPVAAEKLRPHDHAGVEFIYVIQGTLSVHMNDEEHVLEAGDAIYFDATIPHAYGRSGGRLCSAVVVTAA